ncbi:ArsR family transcriptional regulator [Candidatus Bathyarchaeota archaeon]|nr:ArsR family transcriptional regulator [Candidatus Bathyarchaeota archaeon]
MSEVKKVVKKDFETVVGILGNPVRRSIIKKLSEGPDYTLRLSNELNIAQQLAAKHLKIIQDAELVNVIREKSRFGADKNIFQLNKFYSLQIDFSPNLYNERLISFNNPNHWIQQDNYMTKLEDTVTELKNDKLNVDDISPLREVVEIIDEELENLEKRRARLLYIRNLAIGATHGALEEVNYKKKQIIHYLVDQGPINIESLSKNFEMTEEAAKDLIKELEIEGIVKKEGNIVYLETD